MKKCVMAVGAHSDDHELHCGGTLAKYRDMGYEICYVLATNNTAAGMPGSDKTAAQTACTRRREVTEASALLGVKPIYLDYKEDQFQCNYQDDPEPYHVLDFDPCDLSDYPEWGRSKPPLVCAIDMDECVEEMADIMVRYEPELILTHSTNEQNPEHWATSILTQRAFGRARTRVQLGSLLTWYYVDNMNLLYSDCVFVDISEYGGLKLEMVRKHKSQGFDIPNPPLLLRNAAWGAVYGVKLAEKFRVIAAGSPL